LTQQAILRLRAYLADRLRHGLTYRLRQRGKDLGYIQKILRHRRASTTLMYGVPTTADLRNAMKDAEA
jgi:site-specific recombinase XerD